MCPFNIKTCSSTWWNIAQMQLHSRPADINGCKIIQAKAENSPCAHLWPQKDKSSASSPKKEKGKKQILFWSRRKLPSHSRWCPLLCYTGWKGPGKLLFFLNRKTVQARNYSISISGGSRRYTYVVSSCSSKTRIPSSTYVFLVSENCRQRKGQWQQACILFMFPLLVME